MNCLIHDFISNIDHEILLVLWFAAVNYMNGDVVIRGRLGVPRQIHDLGDEIGHHTSASLK